MKEKKARPLKQVLKWLGMLLLLIVCLVAAMLVFLSVTEYRPADRETLDIAGEASAPLHEGDSITVLTWNMGYGALGDNADFFMDGGAMVATADEARVQANLEGMIDQIEAVSPDLLLLQEVDVNSARSHHINETALLRSALPGRQGGLRHYGLQPLPHHFRRADPAAHSLLLANADGEFEAVPEHLPHSAGGQ